MNDELLTISTLQKLSNESDSCWRRRLRRGEVPYLKLGANIRVRRVDFEAWLDSRTIRKARAKSEGQEL
jgi:hypothetical protein